MTPKRIGSNDQLSLFHTAVYKLVHYSTLFRCLLENGNFALLGAKMKRKLYAIYYRKEPI